MMECIFWCFWTRFTIPNNFLIILVLFLHILVVYKIMFFYWTAISSPVNSSTVVLLSQESHCIILIPSAPGKWFDFSLEFFFTSLNLQADRVFRVFPTSSILSLAHVMTVVIKEMDLCWDCRWRWLVPSWTYGKISCAILYCSRMWQRAFSKGFL